MATTSRRSNFHHRPKAYSFLAQHWKHGESAWCLSNGKDDGVLQVHEHPANDLYHIHFGAVFAIIAC